MTPEIAVIVTVCGLKSFAVFRVNVVEFCAAFSQLWPLNIRHQRGPTGQWGIAE